MNIPCQTKNNEMIRLPLHTSLVVFIYRLATCCEQSWNEICNLLQSWVLAPSASGWWSTLMFLECALFSLTCHCDATANKPAVLTFPHLANDNPPDSKFWKLNNKSYFSKHSRNMRSGRCNASLWLHMVFWCNPHHSHFQRGSSFCLPVCLLGGIHRSVQNLWSPWALLMETMADFSWRMY